MKLEEELNHLFNQFNPFSNQQPFAPYYEPQPFVNYQNFPGFYEKPNEPEVVEQDVEELYSIIYYQKELSLLNQLYEINLINFFKRAETFELPNLPSSSYRSFKSFPQHVYMSNLKLKKNYKMVDVLSDGNCLYRALSLTIFGTEKYHVLFRLFLIQELVLQKKFYIQLLKKMNIDFLEVLKSTLELKSWGTEVHLYVLSNSLKRKIVLYDGENFLKGFHQFAFVPRRDEFQVLRIHWSSAQHVHFNALLPIFYEDFGLDEEIPVYGENVINEIK
jgi:hypothetical protein